MGVSRQSVHAWLRRYEEAGLSGLEPRSTRPWCRPHQMPGVVEASREASPIPRCRGCGCSAGRVDVSDLAWRAALAGLGVCVRLNHPHTVFEGAT